MRVMIPKYACIPQGVEGQNAVQDAFLYGSGLEKPVCCWYFRDGV